MADLKISDTKMQETIEVPIEVKTIVHDYDDLVKRRAETQAQADALLSVVRDFDALLERMKIVGCCEQVKESYGINITTEENNA